MEMYLLWGLIGIFVILSYLLLAPFIYYLIGAVVLVYISYPLYQRIEDAVRNDSVAAFLAIILLLLVAVIPTLFTAQRVVSQGRSALVGVGTSTTAVIDTAELEQTVLELTGETVDIEKAIRDAFVEAGRIVSGSAPGLISTVFDTLIGISLMGLTMYYLFKEGPALLDRVKELTPLSGEREEKLLTALDEMAEAVLLGHLLTAAAQGIIAGIGLWAVGIPNVVFWTFAMIILGLIPLVGTLPVWGGAALYLVFITGETAAGVGLAIYGLVVVGVTDNLVRAKLVGAHGTIHPLLVIIGVIGGISLFGMLGVVLGPLVLGFLVILLELYKADFAENVS